MISQGRVEAIVTSKPRERRLLIEEAAGLGKHRKRRRRAQLKLVRTEDNLHRALDVEREARSRLRPLKRQAEAAELHARLERQTLEVRWELSRDQLRAQLAALAHAEAEVGSGPGGTRARWRHSSARWPSQREQAEEALAARSAQREELSRRCFAARSAGDRVGYRQEAVQGGRGDNCRPPRPGPRAAGAAGRRTCGRGSRPGTPSGGSTPCSRSSPRSTTIARPSFGASWPSWSLSSPKRPGTGSSGTVRSSARVRSAPPRRSNWRARDARCERPSGRSKTARRESAQSRQPARGGQPVPPRPGRPSPGQWLARRPAGGRFRLRAGGRRGARRPPGGGGGQRSGRRWPGARPLRSRRRPALVGEDGGRPVGDVPEASTPVPPLPVLPRPLLRLFRERRGCWTGSGAAANRCGWRSCCSRMPGSCRSWARCRARSPVWP